MPPWLKSPCNACGKLGHWTKDCPDTKNATRNEAKPENAKSQEPLTNAPKEKQKRDHHVNFSVQQAIDKLSNNSDIFHFTSTELKGSEKSNYEPFATIFDTGADVHVTNDARLFLLNLGRCLYVPECPATLASALILEVMFNIEYQHISNYKVVSKQKPLHFVKMNEKSMYICDLKPYYECYISKQYVYHLDSDIDSHMRSLTRLQRVGIQKVLEMQRSLLRILFLH